MCVSAWWRCCFSQNVLDRGVCFSMWRCCHINLNVLDLCVFQHGGGDVSHQSECVRPWCVFQHVEVLSHQSECVRQVCVSAWWRCCFSQNVLDRGVCFSMWRCCHINLNMLDLRVFQHGGGAVTHQSVLWISSTCTTSPQLPTVTGQLTETKRRERSETPIV